MAEQQASPTSPRGISPSVMKQDIGEIISFIKTLALFLAIIFLARAAIIEAYRIPSLSMYPTLKEGDHILVGKLSYGLRLPLVTHSLFQWSTPKRGEIVVFTRPDDPKTPEDDSAINIIKRVIGLPGDKVSVHNTTVYINDVPLSEPYARWDLNGVLDGEFENQIVPEDHIFLLGDNRDHSRDSRFWTEHFLPISRVKGRAMIIYWSWAGLSRIGTILK